MRGICACSLAAGTAVGSVLGHKWSQLIGPRYLRLAASGRTSALHRGGRNPREDPGTSLSVQLEALVQADACAQPSADFPASGRAEPGSRAHAHAPEACSLPVQGWPGTVRDWPGIGQLTDRITMSDREVRGERAPSRLSAAPRRWLWCRRAGHNGWFCVTGILWPFRLSCNLVHQHRDGCG